MALPTTGPISLAQVAVELGRPNTKISLGDADVRALAGKPTGPVTLADLLGKASGATLVAGRSGGGDPHEIGFGGSASYGSLTAIAGLTTQPSTFSDWVSGSSRIGSLTFAANMVAELAGKSVYVNGTKITMKAATYSTDTFKTTWEAQAGSSFGFVDGATYSVSIAS